MDVVQVINQLLQTDTGRLAFVIVIMVLVAFVAVLRYIWLIVNRVMKTLETSQSTSLAIAQAQGISLNATLTLLDKTQTDDAVQTKAINAAREAIDVAKTEITTLSTELKTLGRIEQLGLDARDWLEGVWGELGALRLQLLAQIKSSEQVVVSRIEDSERAIMDEIRDMAHQLVKQPTVGWIEVASDTNSVVNASKHAQSILGLHSLSDEDFRLFRAHMTLYDQSEQVIPPTEWPIDKALNTRESQLNRLVGFRYKDQPICWLLVSVEVKPDLVPTRAIATFTDVGAQLRAVREIKANGHHTNGATPEKSVQGAVTPAIVKVEEQNS